MAEIALFGNPRKRRRRTKATKVRRKRRRMKATRASRRPRRRKSRRMRRNMIPTAALANPRRRRKRSRMRYRRNPTVRPLKFVTDNLIPASVGAGGALGLDVLLGFASPYLPVMLTGGAMRPVLRLAGAVGLGMLATQFASRKVGEQVATGAMIVTIYDVLKGMVKSVAPTLSLGEHEYPYPLGYMSPAMTVSEYINGNGYDRSNEMGNYDNEYVGEYVS